MNPYSLDRTDPENGKENGKELDPRVNPVRPDLAASRYRGRYAAAAYVEGEVYHAARGALALHGRPDKAAPLTSQLLYGEAFEVYEIRDGWAWGQARRDDYVGYADLAGLAKSRPQPTHYLTAPASHIYPTPGIKSVPLDTLYMTAELTVSAGSEVRGFVELAGGGWVYGRHLAPASASEADFVATALKFLGRPYLWGGKTVAGLDCSALVQLALFRAGVRAPRDSDQQLAAFGPSLASEAPLIRGDIAFFPGHVGIMLDSARLLHANASHMAVAIDPLEEVIALVAKSSAQPFLGACRLEL